jgi:DNA-binding CsgD family transcriptional regulator
VNDLSFAGLLATLASGFITLTLLASRPEIRGLKHFGRLISNMLLFNLLVILGLAWEFLNSSVWGGALDRQASLPAKEILIGALLILGLLKLGWVYSFELLALSLLDRANPAGMKSVFGAAGGLLLLVAGAAWAPFFPEQRFAFISTTFAVLEYVVIVAVIATAVWLIYTARRCGDIRTRKAVRALGTIYFVLFSGSLMLLVVTGNQAPGHHETSGWANVLGLLLFNPALYIWARKSADIFRGEPLTEICYQPDLVLKYGISGREFEIIALICRGKTNQEIADELCISAQTVKDHNYNIFQKTGVKNRTQLARLFMKRTAA